MAVSLWAYARKSSRTSSAAAAAPVPASKLSGPFDTVLFDLDGTLIETSEIWYLVLKAASVAWGYGDLPREKWAPTFGQSMQMNVASFYPKHTLKELDDFVDENYDRFIPMHLIVLPGARELLKTAYERTGGRVVCVTNCPERLTARLLKHCGFDQYFKSNVVCSGMKMSAEVKTAAAVEDGVIPPKPSPVGCLYALNTVLSGAVRADRAVLIGDSKYDVAAGKAAGVQTIGIGIDSTLFVASSCVVGRCVLMVVVVCACRLQPVPCVWRKQRMCWPFSLLTCPSQRQRNTNNSQLFVAHSIVCCSID